MAHSAKACPDVLYGGPDEEHDTPAGPLERSLRGADSEPPAFRSIYYYASAKTGVVLSLKHYTGLHYMNGMGLATRFRVLAGVPADLQTST